MNFIKIANHYFAEAEITYVEAPTDYPYGSKHAIVHFAHGEERVISEKEWKKLLAIMSVTDVSEVPTAPDTPDEDKPGTDSPGTDNPGGANPPSGDGDGDVIYDGGLEQ